MDSKISSKEKKEELNNTKPKFDNIKSDYFLPKIFDNMTLKKSLEFIKYSKTIQNRLNINIKNYKECSELYSSIV